jgi:glycopeptide antibiotics resistance protein
MEWLFHVGIVDVDDVILNASGVMAGHWAFTVFRRRREAVPLTRTTERPA